MILKHLLQKEKLKELNLMKKEFNRSKDEILLIMKGLCCQQYVADQVNYYQIVNQNDKVIDKALKVISDKNSYNTILGFSKYFNRKF